MFVNMMLSMSSYCILQILLKIEPVNAMLGKGCLWVCSCGYLCSVFIAYIMGLIWRFSEAGKFAAGDELAEDAVVGPLYQVSSGKFISVFYLVSWLLMGTMCCLCMTCVCKWAIKTHF